MHEIIKNETEGLHQMPIELQDGTAIRSSMLHVVDFHGAGDVEIYSDDPKPSGQHNGGNVLTLWSSAWQGCFVAVNRLLAGEPR